MRSPKSDTTAAPPAPSPPSPGRLHALEGLRGLLALWVVLSHFVCWTGWTDLITTGWAHLPWRTFVYAQTAVSVFIILSGYAIWRLAAREQGHWLPFMRGRVWRIYPVYLVALALACAGAALLPGIRSHLAWGNDFYFGTLGVFSKAEREAPLAHLAAHLTLLHGAVPQQALPAAAGSILSPAWSLSLEWQFYLVAPLLWRARRNPLAWLAVGAVAWLGHRYRWMFANPMNAFLPSHVPLFLIGIGSAAAEDAWNTRETARRLTVLAGIAALVALALFRHLDRWALLIWLPTFAVAAGWLGDSPPVRFLRSTLQCPPLQWLGRISYPLYLLHWPLLILGVGLLVSIRSSWSAPQLFATLVILGLPAILAASHLVHRTIEKPAMDRARRHR